MRISRAQGIEGPGNFFYADRERLLTLGKFEPVSNAHAAMRRPYAQHVGVKSCSAVLQAGDGESETDKLRLFKRADPHGASGARGNSESQGRNVSIVGFPRQFFEIEGKLQISDGFKIANQNLGFA